MADGAPRSPTTCPLVRAWARQLQTLLCWVRVGLPPSLASVRKDWDVHTSCSRTQRTKRWGLREPWLYVLGIQCGSPQLPTAPGLGRTLGLGQMAQDVLWHGPSVKRALPDLGPWWGRAASGAGGVSEVAAGGRAVCGSEPRGDADGHVSGTWRGTRSALRELTASGRTAAEQQGTPSARSHTEEHSSCPENWVRWTQPD